MGLSSQVSYVKNLYGALAKWPLGFSPKVASMSDYAVIMGGGKSTDPEDSSVTGANFFDFYLKTTGSGASDVAGLKIQLDAQSAGSGYAIKATGKTSAGVSHAEIGGIYAQAQASGGTITGQQYAGFFEYIVDTGIANAPSGGCIQLAAICDGALNDETGFISLRDYGTNKLKNLFNIAPEIASGTGKMWYGSTLRIRINSAAKYLMMSDAENAMTFTGNLVMSGDIDMSTLTTGNYDLILKDAQADALSIRRSTTDMMVFDSSTPKIAITPIVTIGANPKALFIGADSDTAGSGIRLVGADWNTSQGIGFYADDGGAAQTGYTETFTARYLLTAAIASGDVSMAAMHPDLTINANYTGTGGLSAIWGNTTIKSGRTVDTSGGLGDVSGGTFGVDIVGVLAANSHACGVSVGVGGSGTKTGILCGFRMRGATGTVDWDGILSIEDGDGSWTSLTKAAASNTATMTNSPKTGNPAYWMKMYIAETAYYFPVWTD